MHTQDATHDNGGARDKRPPSLGLGRIIIALFWVLGVWIFATAIIDLFHGQGKPWGPQLVALLAGIDYLVAATALTHNGKRMRMVGWVAISLSIGIPLVLWVASLGLDEDFYDLPLVVSLIGIVWMWRSNPRRIVSLAEQVERSGPPWKAS